jgi:Transcriptional regulator
MSGLIGDSVGRPTPEQLVERLIDAASRLLAEKGPSAIKARGVAEVARVSTTAVYYHLGGLPELIQAVVDRGFRDLGRAFTSVPASDDPVADLFSMALTSLAFARRNPHLYDLMFGLSTRGSYRQPQASGRDSAVRSEAFQAAYTHLVGACRRLVQAGRIRSESDPAAVADQLWSCVHGFITLELGGYLDRSGDPVGSVLQPMTVNLLVGLGDAAELAHASHTSARAGHPGLSEPAPPTA